MSKSEDKKRAPDHFATHVCVVSAQAAPNLLALLDPQLKPKRVVLLVSKEMRTQAQNLTDVIKESGIQVERLELPDVHSYDQIQESLFALDAPKYGEVAVNISGGTKLMALALNSICTELNFPVFYLDVNTDHVTWLPQKNVSPRPSIRLREQLKLRHYLLGYGFSFEDKSKPEITRDEEDFVIKVVTEYSTFEKGLSQLNYIGQKCEKSRKLKHPLTDDEQDSRSLMELLKVASSCKILNLEGDRAITYTSEATRDFAKGGWLEVHTFNQVTKLTGALDIRDRACNLEVISNDSVKNEIDIAFLARNRLHTIECKTGNLAFEGGYKANDALFKLAENARRFGGIGTKSMLVTFRTLGEPERRLARALNVTVVQGKELASLSSHIKKWVVPA